MDLDFRAYFERLQDEVRGRKNLHQSMVSLMDWCSQRLHHRDWKRLATLVDAEDSVSAREWLPGVLARAPCPFPIRGVYFGLGEFTDSNGIEFADLYVGFMSEYDRNDLAAEWLFSDPLHYPDEAYLGSETLRKAGVLCNREKQPPGLGVDGNVAFSVAFAALLLRTLLDEKAFRLFKGTGPIGVVTGFDSGDLVRIGEVTAGGFVANPGPMV